jgi:signal transduction histidine kinase
MRMNDNELLKKIRIVMMNINLIIILLISFLVCFTTYKIEDTMTARDFLYSLEKYPVTPWKALIVSCLAFAILLTLMFSKSKIIKKEIHLYIYGFIQLILCLIIMWSLDFNVNTILLLISADIIISGSNSIFKIIYAGFLFILHVFLDFSFISNIIPVNSIQVYLAYYNGNVRALISGLETFLISSNNVLFMCYMVLLVRIQFLENQRITLLNKKLDHANEKLQVANIQLGDYAKTMEKMAETRERNRLAREIHDTLGHTLTGIIAGIDACTVLVQATPKEAQRQLKFIGNVARQGMTDIRRSVNALRPDALDKLTFAEALNQNITEMKMITNAEITLNNRVEDISFSEDEEDVIYRIVQESVTNSIRHGAATKIDVLLEKELNILEIIIKDNGIGCKDIKKGFGLLHMRERLKMLRGELEYNGDEGFIIKAKIPIRWRK